MPVLEQWSVYADPYHAPETRVISLVGVVTGHPSKPDGLRVQTSMVVSTEGRLVTTYSGTVYWLGEPELGYREWLTENRPHWDPENPVTMVPE